MTLYPRERWGVDSIRQLLPEDVPLLSLRVLPPVPGSLIPGLAQLIRWHAKIILDSRSKALTGPVDLKLGGTAEDPLDRVKIHSIITGLYVEFDMELHVDEILREWVIKP
jgi:acetoacetate decarboxylase